MTDKYMTWTNDSVVILLTGVQLKGCHLHGSNKEKATRWNELNKWFWDQDEVADEKDKYYKENDPRKLKEK